MNSRRTAAVAASLWVSLVLASGAWAADPGPAALRLVPMPRELRQGVGSARLDSRWVVLAPAAEDRRAAELLCGEALRRFGWDWRPASGKAARGVIELHATSARPGDSALFVRQGYRLTVEPHRIVIEGVSAQGRFYGVQTLRQLLCASTGELPCLRIRDYPALEWRGISDDLARGQVSTMADFRALIRQLAYYKVNLYQFTIEDLSALESGESSADRPGALTGAEVRQLVVEGLRNHVVISPIFQTLGHEERLTALGEAMRRSAGSPASARGFAPDQPGAIEFVSALAGRIAEATHSPLVHLGGDEWPALSDTTGRDSPDKRRAALVYGTYLGALARELRARHGCRAMAYGDVLLKWPAVAQTLPRDIVVVDWHYDQMDSVPSLSRLAGLGFHDVLVSPGLWNWSTFYPNYARAFPNIAALAAAGKRAGSLGCIVSSWGDSGAESLRENNWTGYAYAAAASWEPGVPTPSEFLPRFVTTFYGVDSGALANVERLLGWQDLAGVTTVGRVFHHALLVRPGNDAWNARMTAMRDDMREAQDELLAAAGAIRDHRGHVAALAHGIRQFRYLAERELALDEIGRSLRGRSLGQLDAESRARILSELERLHETARALADEYPRLWLANNRPPASPYIEDRMARQAAMLDRLCELARAGRLTTDESFSGMQAGAY